VKEKKRNILVDLGSDVVCMDNIVIDTDPLLYPITTLCDMELGD